MKLAGRLISLFLLAAFSLVVVPKEMLHGFTHHEDSADRVCVDYCRHHIEEEHQHCEVLQLSSPPFYKTVNQFYFSFEKILCIQSFECESSFHFSLSPFLFFRGPPAIV
jgi:hypothetical protein